MTRATLDPDGQPINKVTPFVDQNQTYTSNASAQVFHREYEMRDDGNGNLRPFATGRLLNGNEASGGGLATWADIKAQARDVLGIELNDFNIHSIPRSSSTLRQLHSGRERLPAARAFDRSGHAGRGPGSGGQRSRPRFAPRDGRSPPATPSSTTSRTTPIPDAGEVADGDDDCRPVRAAGPPGEQEPYDNELLDAHYITGDGRGNENIGLTAVHHVFHSEHNRQVDLIKNSS